jgi:superfamily II DNA or RNA helicase
MNHPDKIEITRKILDARPFAKAITFSGTIKQAEKINRGFVVHSGKTKKKNRLTLEEFAKLPSGVINSSKSLNEGIDIKGLDLAIILTNSSSPNEKVQRIGRVIRKEEGKIAEVFTLVIKGTVEERWFENSSQYSSYIEITEKELDDILAGDTIERLEQDGKEVDELFRL